MTSQMGCIEVVPGPSCRGVLAGLPHTTYVLFVSSIQSIYTIEPPRLWPSHTHFKQRKEMSLARPNALYYFFV